MEQRITFLDVIHGIVSQAPEIFCEEDFLPLPCAHPNGHVVLPELSHDGIPAPLTVAELSS